MSDPRTPATLDELETLVKALRAENQDVQRRVIVALGPFYHELGPDLDDAHAGYVAEVAARQLRGWIEDAERRQQHPSAQDLLLQIRARQQEETETFQHLAEHAAVADQAVAAERRRLRQQIAELPKYHGGTRTINAETPAFETVYLPECVSLADILKLLGPEA